MIPDEPAPWNAPPDSRASDTPQDTPPDYAGRCPACGSPAFMAAERAAKVGERFECPDCGEEYIQESLSAIARGAGQGGFY